MTTTKTTAATTAAKWAVVTGASRGIGRALCERLAKDGYSLVALARSEQGLEKLRRELSESPSAAGVAVRTYAVDLADTWALQETSRHILAEGPVPDVLVNNAGIAFASPLDRTETDAYERVMAINLRAPFLLCRTFLPEMAKRGSGRVVNVASVAALKGFKYTAAYCASKHGLLGMTRALAVEYAKRGVTVNALCPGWTETDILTQSAEAMAAKTGRSVDEAKDVYAKMNALGRVIRPEEVAELCAYLVSPSAAAVTGAAFTIDGGETL